MTRQADQYTANSGVVYIEIGDLCVYLDVTSAPDGLIVQAWDRYNGDDDIPVDVSLGENIRVLASA